MVLTIIMFMGGRTPQKFSLFARKWNRAPRGSIFIDFISRSPLRKILNTPLTYHNTFLEEMNKVTQTKYGDMKQITTNISKVNQYLLNILLMYVVCEP